MSLILDALRKLERDKEAREPGVLVVGAVPWGQGRRSRRPVWMALGAGVLLVLAFAGWWRWRSPPLPAAAPVARPAAAAPVPAPVAATPAPLASPATVDLPKATAPAPEPPPARSLAVPDTAEAVRLETAPAPSSPDELRLNAIAVRDGRPVALVNDRLVFEGDSFDGVTVVRIGEAEVEVEVRGVRRVLRF